MKTYMAESICAKRGLFIAAFARFEMTKLPRRQHRSPRNTDRVVAMALSDSRPAIVRSVMPARRRLFAVMLSITLAQATAACGGIAPGIFIAQPGQAIGASTSPDYERAREVRRARASAERGEPDDQNSLGVYYEFGYGVPQDYAKAAKWYRLAAEQGLALAQNNLGELYDRGLGVTQDYVQADMWFILAAAGGSYEAPNNRDHIETLMTPSQIEQAQQLARDWLAKHQP